MNEHDTLGKNCQIYCIWRPCLTDIYFSSQIYLYLRYISYILVSYLDSQKESEMWVIWSAMTYVS